MYTSTLSTACSLDIEYIAVVPYYYLRAHPKSYTSKPYFQTCISTSSSQRSPITIRPEILPSRLSRPVKRKTMADVQDAHAQGSESADEDSHSKKKDKKSKREVLPAETLKILKGWILSPDNFKLPFPSEEEQIMLME